MEWKYEYREARFTEGHLWRLASTVFTYWKVQTYNTVDWSIAKEPWERICRCQSALGWTSGNRESLELAITIPK